MSDNYLVHWAKGKEAKDHKYSARQWVNGRWQYIYGALGGNAKRRYDQSVKETSDYVKGYQNWQSESRNYDYNLNKLNQANKRYNDARKGYEGKLDEADKVEQALNDPNNHIRPVDRREMVKQADQARSDAKKNKAAWDKERNSTERKTYATNIQFGQQSYAQNKAKYSNYNTKLNDKIAKTKEAKTAWEKTPLYKIQKAASAGKAWVDKLFNVRRV